MGSQVEGQSECWDLSTVRPACSGLLENVGRRERVADESQIPDVERMLQAALGCLSMDWTTPGAAVRLRPLAHS